MVEGTSGISEILIIGNIGHSRVGFVSYINLDFDTFITCLFIGCKFGSMYALIAGFSHMTFAIYASTSCSFANLIEGIHLVLDSFKHI